MSLEVNRSGSKLLFDQFLQEKRYIQNVSQHTVDFYRQSFKAFNLSLPPTQAQLNSEIVRLREEGKSPNGINAYIRGLRPFLSWLHENGHLQDRLKLKKLKCEEKHMRTFSDAQVRAILSYKSKTKTEYRLLALVTLLTDTGVRINEALTLTRVAQSISKLPNCAAPVSPAQSGGPETRTRVG